MNNSYIKILSLFLTFLLCAIAYPACASAAVGSDPSQSIIGYVDHISIDNGVLTAKGWAYDTHKKIEAAKIQVYVNDKLVYDQDFVKNERPDVVQSTGFKGAFGSGWEISEPLSSKYKNLNLQEGFSVHAVFEDGRENVLHKSKISTSSSMVSVHAGGATVGLAALLLFFLLIFILAFIHAERVSAYISSKGISVLSAPLVPGTVIATLFLIFVGLGVTGSSIQIGLSHAPFVQADEVEILGPPRPIRSDEWAVFTPLAISQTYQEPKFPIVNPSVGIDGQNMLVVGMVGAPVRHITAIAKPATWGFFVFELRQALSWYWWFPAFGCLLALWWLFCLIYPEQWRLGFFISLIFSSSAYVVAWSYWPAYITFFPCVALASIMSLVRAKSVFRMGILSILLGLSVAGFALTLYPPLQISLSYLFSFLLLAVFYQRKLYLSINFRSVFFILCAVFIFGFIVLSWWLDAKDAIHLMMETIYPGQRTSQVGGDLSLVEVFRGITNFSTLYDANGFDTNESSIASFYYFLPGVLMLFILNYKKKTLKAVDFALVSFAIFCLYYMMIGIPLGFAEISQWGRVPSIRADLALGLCITLLIGSLMTGEECNSTHAKVSATYSIVVPLVSAIATCLLAAVALLKMRETAGSALTSEMIWISLLISALGGGTIVLRNYKYFLSFVILLSVITVARFNPISIAPSYLNADAAFAYKGAREAVIGSQIPAMMLLASGQPISNGVFYYPPASFWHGMDPEGRYVNLYNRYQHLIIVLGEIDSWPYFKVGSPQLDVVMLTVDPYGFDFKKLGALYIIVPVGQSEKLVNNPSLNLVNSSMGWSRFKVKGFD